MREGRDLNQQGQAARHEQASSSSPVIFQGTLASLFASAAPPQARLQPIRTSQGLMGVNFFIVLFLSLMVWVCTVHHRNNPPRPVRQAKSLSVALFH
jgi:hypothetical protein